MAISSLSSALNVSVYQQGMNSGDALQNQVSAALLKRGLQQDKQNVQALVQSVAASSPAVNAPEPGKLGHSVNVYA